MPSIGTPCMNIQFRRILRGRALKPMNMAGAVHDIPSAR